MFSVFPLQNRLPVMYADHQATLLGFILLGFKLRDYPISPNLLSTLRQHDVKTATSTSLKLKKLTWGAVSLCETLCEAFGKAQKKHSMDCWEKKEGGETERSR